MKNSFVAAALTVVGANVAAQATLGDLLDSGAQRMSGSELSELIPNSKWNTPTGSPFSGVQEFLPGGTFTGYEQSGVGWARGIHGTWNIDAQDRLCFTYVYLGSSRSPICRYWYRNGDKFFASTADETGSRNAPVGPRVRH